jgi:hypothetical protein
MTFLTSESPNVLIREIDLSGSVPAVTSSTGAFVGDFLWGPAETPILVGNEAQLVANFGAPKKGFADEGFHFLQAASFLKYSSSLYVVRCVDTGSANAWNAPVEDDTEFLIKNRDHFNALVEDGALDGEFFAKYPGELGNSLRISVCGSDQTIFDEWEFSNLFPSAPLTSPYVAARSPDGASAHDELHVVIVDELGYFTGVAGTVLETFGYLSASRDAKAEDGSSIFWDNVLNDRSQYVWCNADGTIYEDDLSNSFDAATDGTDQEYTEAQNFTFFNGWDAGGLSPGEYSVAWDQFADPDLIQVDFLLAPSDYWEDDQTDIINNLELLARTRKDCIVVASPPGVIVNRDNSSSYNVELGGLTTSQIAQDTILWLNGNYDSENGPINASSYLVMDNNHLKVYNKYLDRYEYIAASSSTAGIMAATTFDAAPWFSPAGTRRGIYRGASSVSYNPNKTERDLLYKAGVNPIFNMPGQGIVLYGDKTYLNRPSAFDRINVRRLFLVMERAIKRAAQNVLFEFNDEFTRAEFVNIVEPFLREIKGRRGITDFRVVCDETNNTPSVIDSNQFVASVFVKPARSINYVTLNFVAVRTGADFEEVVGLV